MRRLLPAVALLIAVAASGCISPYLKRDSKMPEPKPAPALVAGMSVQFESAAEKSAIDAAVDMAQNAGLEEFGKVAAELSAASLAQHGYNATYDGPRSSKLDLIQLSSNSTAAALTGHWRHPESSHQGPDTVEGILVNTSEIMGKLKVEGQSEFFAFTKVSIRDNGIFMKEPYVVVRTKVFDAAGKKVLELQGVGAGDSSFMFADRSPANLKVALERGFESLKTVQEQPL